MQKRVKFRLHISSLLVLCTTLSSCNYYESKSIGDTAISDPIAKSAVDFEVVRSAIFAPKCVACHSHYGNYQNVVRELSSIQNAIQSNRMPKNDGPLSGTLRATLDAWIASGSPERREAPSRPPPTENLEATWASISANVVFPKCLVCHNPNGQAKFLDLSDRQVIFQSRNRVFAGGAKLIDFDEPEKSYLIEILLDEAEPMPPTSSNIERVDKASVDIITEWVRRGLP